MGFLRQEYQSRLPSPFPGELPDSGIKPVSAAFAKQILYRWANREVQLLLYSAQNSGEIACTDRSLKRRLYAEQSLQGSNVGECKSLWFSSTEFPRLGRDFPWIHSITTAAFPKSHSQPWDSGSGTWGSTPPHRGCLQPGEDWLPLEDGRYKFNLDNQMKS